jgi:hypothetical protein
MVAGADLHQVETTRDGSHLRCNVKVDGVRARGIGFGMGKSVPALQADGSGRLVGVQFQVDSWQGSLRPEFIIEHIAAPPAWDALLCECGPACSSWLPLAPAAERMAPSEPERRGHVSLRMPIARDLRDRPGRTSALAQVLATGEPALVLGCSAPHMLVEARERLPFADLCRSGLTCVARGCAGADASVVRQTGVVLTEWEVAESMPDIVEGRAHLVAAGPPYRRQHVAFLERVAREGVNIHLNYGHEERQSTAKLLRYLVHPRFAMVCVYRSLEAARAREEDPGEAEVLAHAATLAWEEARVALSLEALRRAAAVVAELGLDRLPAGEAKLEARSIPAYAEAEADYEECSRLCQTL